MMGRQDRDQGSLFYELRLEDMIPKGHLLRRKSDHDRGRRACPERRSFAALEPGAGFSSAAYAFMPNRRAALPPRIAIFSSPLSVVVANT